MMSDKPYLLTDDQIISFVIHGYHIVEVDFPDGINGTIYDKISQLENNPGDGILDISSFWPSPSVWSTSQSIR